MNTLRRDLLILTALAVLLFFPGLGRRDLWNPDEARYAEVAREMRQSHSWALPRLNGQTYTQKPPLLYWLMIACGALRGGIDETAARIPSALAAVGAVLLVFRIGDRLFGRRAGWLAAAVFATSFKILWQGRFGQIDMLLTALVALAVWFWVRGYTEGRPALYPLFFLCAGLATLAKGPVGLLPPLLSILAFLALTRNGAEAKRLRPGLGLLLWAAVVLAWLIPAGLAGGQDYLRQIVFKQNVTRYADPWHHREPWYYFLQVLPGDFFPWCLLLPAGVLVARKRLAGKEREGALFCLCWIVVTLLFFSLSPAKRDVYVLTMYPAMALLIGAALDRIATDWPRDRRWVQIPLGLLTALALLTVAAPPILGARRPDEIAPLGGVPFLWMVSAAFVPLVLGSAWAWWESRAGRIVRATAGVAAGMALVVLTAAFFLLPRFDTVKSARPLSQVLLQHMKPGEPYGIYPRLDSTFLIYTGRFAVELDSEKKLRQFAASPGRVWILAQRDDLAKLAPPLPVREVARDPDPDTGYLLLTQR
ncbi:MAG TPA: glycosyltransferase family 39 protein [Thermoanaerobaculia bacterium]|nr:glycosyltransferase family 39 protein [Thermoanaerobaculia bacterium]